MITLNGPQINAAIRYAVLSSQGRNDERFIQYMADVHGATQLEASQFCDLYEDQINELEGHLVSWLDEGKSVPLSPSTFHNLPKTVTFGEEGSTGGHVYGEYLREGSYVYPKRRFT